LKKVIAVIITCLIFISLFSFQNVAADDVNEGIPKIEQPIESQSVVAIEKVPVIEAGAAIVIEASSGRILYQKNGFSKRPMASTTKIMTAIIALENGNLNDKVVVSKRAAQIGGSTIDLKEGETLSLNDMLYGLMLNSGNDAAIAIAEHIGGTVENFVGMMNEKAEELGAKDTFYKSPHGLDNPDHYTTAYDLALITKYALSNPIFSKIVSTKTTSIKNRSLYNTNEMLGMYQGVDGVKTGYTGQAGRCLVTTAMRDNMRIISVVLNCGTVNQRARNTKSILDYAFNNYKMYNLVYSGQFIKNIPVIKGIKEYVPAFSGSNISVPLNMKEFEGIETEIDLPDKMRAPVNEGTEIGSIKYIVKGEVLGRTVLRTGASVRRKGFLDYFGDIITRWERQMQM
jgi:serine-type D-Ala-D-Ala carboxypeptidase (penicillin-binding protein 5/6)